MMMPTTALRLIRKMRGGAQAHLVEADDGHFYVVKFQNNPQGRRILLNEWFGSHILRHLGIACPHVQVLRITREFLDDFPEVCITTGTRNIAVNPGLHFGSRYPGDPERMAVYDFVPDTVLQKVVNRREFAGMLAVDKWTCNADARQTIFIRTRVSDYVSGVDVHPRQVAFIALMIDHGYLFNGQYWDCIDAPVTGLYVRPLVYDWLRTWSDLQPWLDGILTFPEHVINEALRQVPPEWIDNDGAELGRLFEILMRRKVCVQTMLLNCFHARRVNFPNWSER
jgi:hypothetical protein